MASTLAWSSKYSVGIKGIDRQHQELLRRVNAVFEAIGSGKTAAEVEEVLGFMNAYVRTHFLCEEKLMRRHGYQGLEAHRTAHQHFYDEMAAVERLHDRFGTSEVVALRLTALLTEWLTDHFLTVDKDLADFLAAKTARPRARHQPHAA